MEISLSNHSRQTRVKRSYWLANTSVTHVSNKKPSILLLASALLDQKLPATDALFELLITVDDSHIASLRQIASVACGEKIDSFQIQPTKKPTQRLIRLRCVGKATIARLMSAIVAQLECAEFGRVCRI